MPLSGFREPVGRFLGAKITFGIGLYVGIRKLLNSTVFGGAFVLCLEPQAQFRPESLFLMDRKRDLMIWKTLIPFVPKTF